MNLCSARGTVYSEYFPVTASGDEYSLEFKFPEELKTFKVKPSFKAMLSAKGDGINIELPPLDEMFLDFEEFEEACNRWRQDLLVNN